MRNSDNFHCQQKCGHEDFSIDRWNEVFRFCMDNNLSDEKTDRLLHGEPCEEQCFDCMAIVGKQKLKTKKLMKKLKVSNNTSHV